MLEDEKYTQVELFKEKKDSRLIWSVIDYDFPYQGDETNEIYRITNDWFNRLKIVRLSTENRTSFPEKSIKEFTAFLINNQREQDADAHFNADGSFAIPEGVEMETDARVEFVYFPSYIATAYLCLIKQDYPNIYKSFSNFDVVLKKALDFCSNRHLQGHGYDSIQESLTAIEYLSYGKVFKYIKSHREESKKFHYAVYQARKIIREKLKDNSGWGAIDEDSARVSLMLLSGKNIEVFGFNPRSIH